MRNPVESINLKVAPDLMARPQQFHASPSLTQVGFEDTEWLAERPHIEEELVIEEVSIDGMCGVY
jgi:mycofactocin precursor